MGPAPAVPAVHQNLEFGRGKRHAECGEAMPPEQRLTQITPLPRQAFLLLSLEGFSEEDAASYSRPMRRVRKLVENAGREIAAEIATDVLIIEDETFIAMDIESAGGKPRPQRHRRRPHPYRGGGARAKNTARADPRRHPARRRQLRSRRRQRTAAARSRCR